MAEHLIYEDQQNNCSNNSQDAADDNNAPSNYNNYKTISCEDMNGDDYNRTICDILPNNNVFVSDTISSPCYSSELECNTNSLNSTSGCLENTPSSSSPASGLNPYSNSSTPGNFGESDSYSESSQEYQTELKPETNYVAPILLSNEHRNDNNSIKIAQDQSNGVYKSASKVTRTTTRKKTSETSRGRPRKALVPMYHSQISGDKNAIKICIKKSNSMPPNKRKSAKRKKQKMTSDTDVSDYEGDKKKKGSTNSSAANEFNASEPQNQGPWGESLPPNILYKIFQYTCADGSLPTLVRLSRVCKLWREVAIKPTLWTKVDLNWVKERFRNDIKLHSLIQERLPYCQDLNLGEWKLRDIQAALSILSVNCTKLKGLNLSSWKGLSADNLKYISTEFVNLERLDLSCINSSCINATPLVNLIQTMNERLTHLVLAHNKLHKFTPIMTSIAENCRNLQLLDISNIKTFALKSGRLYIEKLQIGCPVLRVLRITNSHVTLAPATVTEQMQSPGFPLLEELSIAGLEDKITIARAVLDDDIERILKTSNKLKLLDIRGCIKLTDSGLVRVPAWDLEHLFLSGCCITRAHDSGLELILQKWSHSLVEIDLAWSTATSSLDAAVLTLAEKGNECPIQTINLCGSSVSLEPIKAVLAKCPNIKSINLQSCRALPRGIKRHYTGSAVKELKDSLEEKPKTEFNEDDAEQLCQETT